MRSLNARDQDRGASWTVGRASGCPEDTRTVACRQGGGALLRAVRQVLKKTTLVHPVRGSLEWRTSYHQGPDHPVVERRSRTIGAKPATV